MNKELLLKVADAIEANPEHFDMENWFQETACGTAACVVGWALHLHEQNENLQETKDSYFSQHSWRIFEEVTGLKGKDFESLAQVDHWVPAFRGRYGGARTAKSRAEAAAEYVRWFVENN